MKFLTLRPKLSLQTSQDIYTWMANKIAEGIFDRIADQTPKSIFEKLVNQVES